MKRNVLSILDVAEELEQIIDLGITMKHEVKAGTQEQVLKGKTLAMLFERPSTRTRASFEVGMTLLGGHALFLKKDEIGIGKRESAEDVAYTLSHYVDAIVYRALRTQDLQEIAAHATIPVINGLDRNEHPCQIMADFMTIKEKKGVLKGLHFVFIGDGDDNLAHSYLLGSPCVGMDVTIISPKNYWPEERFVTQAQDLAVKKGTAVTITDDLHAISSADLVATDTWISLWYENERVRRMQDLYQYTVTPLLMKDAKEDALFLHCMPIHYGEEVTRDVAHGPQSVIIDEAENRLWVQMALICKLLRDHPAEKMQEENLQGHVDKD
jgi:ornithine carbamoyltransferase